MPTTNLSVRGRATGGAAGDRLSARLRRGSGRRRRAGEGSRAGGLEGLEHAIDRARLVLREMAILREAALLTGAAAGPIPRPLASVSFGVPGRKARPS